MLTLPFGPQSKQFVQRRAELGDVWVNYTVAGKGKPVVLIHGLAASGRWWERNIDFLAQHFTVYTLDLVGFGDSKCGAAFVLTEAARLVYDWMDHVSLTRATLIGHSMGGFVAADFAAEFPDRVERLILVDAAATRLPHSVPSAFLSFAREAWQAPLSLISTCAVDVMKAGMRTIWNAAWELRDGDIVEKLGQVQAKTLIIWGELDSITPLRMGHELVDLIPDAQLVVLPNCGHSPMWEDCDDFNELVLKFISPAAARRTEKAREQGLLLKPKSLWRTVDRLSVIARRGRAA